MNFIGILGVGHLAEAIVTGLMRARFDPGALLLSPRGKAAAVGAKFDIGLATDNTDLVRRSDLVLLAVRPAAAVAAVAGLPWRDEQTLVSACAGVRITDLAPAAAPARIVRIMPLTAAAIGASPTVIYPECVVAARLLQHLGSVIPLGSEADFEAATVSAAVYGWVQALIGESAAWSAAHGLDAGSARRLTAETFIAAGRMIAESREPIDTLLERLVTPGGITERGLDILSSHQSFAAWRAACDGVLAKLLG